MTLGRPRAFCVDKALDKALGVFWRKGYEGASLPELTKAMGINRPSMYAAFGNKEALFRKALERYSQTRAELLCEALSAPTAREVFEGVLRGAADALTDPECPPGCLAVQGALACGKDAEPIKKELCARRAATEELLRKRFEKAKAEGDWPEGDGVGTPADMARFVSTVMQGMAVQAAGGATRRELRKVAETAAAVWAGEKERSEK